MVDGIQTPETVTVEGWHCNLRLLGGSDDLKNKLAPHYCKTEKSAMSIEAGKPCNWCGAVEPTTAQLPTELQQCVVTPDVPYVQMPYEAPGLQPSQEYDQPAVLPFIPHRR